MSDAPNLTFPAQRVGETHHDHAARIVEGAERRLASGHGPRPHPFHPVGSRIQSPGQLTHVPQVKEVTP